MRIANFKNEYSFFIDMGGTEINNMAQPVMT